MSDNLSRREILAYSAAFGSAFLAAQGIAAADDPKAKKDEKPKESPAAKAPGKKYDDEEVHQSLGFAVSAEDDAQGVLSALQGRRL